MGVRITGQDLEQWLRGHTDIPARDDRTRTIKSDIALGVLATAIVHLGVLVEIIGALSNISGV